MPHSSGGGSHGGGSHGGGSQGSSGPRVSRSYYPGARRYLRHHRNSGLDEYVYASSKPRRANLSSIIILIIFFAIFALGIGASTFNDMPKRLNGLYDNPAVHDDIDVIKDDEALTQTLKDYYVLTGICPVVYTVYDEQWSSRNPNLDVIYEDLETYTYFKYVDNFEDEKHFVIVYSVPMEGQELYEQGKIDVPDYSWEAVQGDDTDPIITESMFRKFSNIVQVNLEKGRDPGKAFEAAFEYAFENAESKLNPSVGSWIANSLSSMFPLLFVALHRLAGRHNRHPLLDVPPVRVALLAEQVQVLFSAFGIALQAEQQVGPGRVRRGIALGHMAPVKDVGGSVI